MGRLAEDAAELAAEVRRRKTRGARRASRRRAARSSARRPDPWRAGAAVPGRPESCARVACDAHLTASAVDDRLGIAAGLPRELPRLVHRAALDAGELGHVAAHVVAVGVEAPGLPDRVEDAVRPGVDARCPRPTASCRCCWRRRRRRAGRGSAPRRAASRGAGPWSGSEPVSSRARLCIQPSRASCRMPASMIGIAGAALLPGCERGRRRRASARPRGRKSACEVSGRAASSCA